MKATKEIACELVFNETGTFGAMWAAQAWCAGNGYSYGSTCRNEPIGLLLGDFAIAKWRNLNNQERKDLDGVMTSLDFREGPVTITLYK